MSTPPVSRIAILGATGNTGFEAARILLAHPRVQVTHVTTTSRVGVPLADVHPRLRGLTDLVLSPFEPETLAHEVDGVVSCLPHKASMQSVAALAKENPQLKIVDLSGDFRFPEVADYEAAYDIEHVAPDLNPTAAYGLPELFRDEIARANIVANPGCYPTASLLALAPLGRAGLIERAIVDAKSGLSGAGAKPSPITHFTNANESVQAYKPYAHRHAPEIGAHLARVSGSDAPLTFTPHLVPMDVGIFATVYIQVNKEVTEEEVRGVFDAAYGDEPFVRILPPGVLPNTKHVAGTNLADLNVAVAPDGRQVTVFSAIDNTLKGASGQAVQNLNLLLGLPETLGFPEVPQADRPVLTA